MPAVLFLLYVAVEVAAVIAVAHVVGVLWTLVILVAVWTLGLQLVRAQGRRAVAGLRRAARGDGTADGAVAEGAIVAVGSLLMLIPGLVTAALGLLLLLPPTRFLLRPLAVLLASRRFGMLGAATMVFTRRGDGEVIDGEVVDARYDDQPTRPGYTLEDKR